MDGIKGEDNGLPHTILARLLRSWKRIGRVRHVTGPGSSVPCSYIAMAAIELPNIGLRLECEQAGEEVITCERGSFGERLSSVPH
jgi:hypothetical protein